MRRLLIVAVVLLVTSATLLLAAGGGEAAGGDGVRVVYNNFSAGESNAQVLNAMLELFAEKYPEIEVVNDAMGYGDAYWTQLTTRIAGGNAPDAFEINMENFVPYAARNVMLPLDEYYEASGADQGVYSPAVLEAASYEGTLYAVPQSFSTVMLTYNQDLFDEAGVAYPSEQWTWDDALEAAKAISNLGDDMWGQSIGIHFWEFFKIVQQNGGALVSEDGTGFTINSPENLETLRYMVDRVRTHHVMPNEDERADRSEVDMFVEGRLGMFAGGVWNFNELKTRAPEGMRWSIEVEPGNTAKATHFFANVSAVSKDSENPEEAFTLLNFLGSDPGVVDLRLAAGWELPTISDPQLVDAYISQRPPDNRESVFRSLEYVVRPPALKQFSELATLVSTKLEMARDGILTPAEALDQAQEEAERTISLD